MSRTNTDHDSRERIRRLLLEAFCTVPPPEHVDTSRLNADAYRQLRADLHLIGSEGLQFYLPRVLEELLDSHTCDPSNPDGADAVVRHLNISSASSEAGRVEEGADLEYFRDEREHLCREKTAVYARFSKQQALAILEWLKLARSWPDLKFQASEIDGAIQYWEQFALS